MNLNGKPESVKVPDSFDRVKEGRAHDTVLKYETRETTESSWLVEETPAQAQKRVVQLEMTRERKDTTPKRNQISLQNRESIQKPKRYENNISDLNLKELRTMHEAMQSDETNQWQRTIEEELETLNRNQTWKIVNRLTKSFT